MNIFSKIISKKRFAAIAIGVVLLMLIVPTGLVHAQTSQPQNLLSCASAISPSCVIYYISLVANSIIGGFISFAAVLIKVGLALDANVFASPTVQKGFSVALALANLGFVIAIIVIALATILRNQTYGIKQMLWKLVVMAVLVNFGLVITAPIVGFADSLTTYFINASGGNSTAFVNNLTNAFAPQVLLNPPEKQGTSATQKWSCGILGNLAAGPAGETLCNSIANYAQGDSTGATDFFESLMALVFSAVFETIVLITFGAIAILLIVRYVYLSFLLIILPLAWLAWIFPKLEHHFSEWWGKFIQWSFFPALTLFFIYLALQMASLNTAGNVQIPATALQASGVNTPEFAVAFLTGSVSLLQTALDEILLCGLCIGGLFAAQSIGIKGAGAAIHAAQWTGDKVKGYAGKKARNGARNVGDHVRSAGRQYDARSKQTTTALQRFGSKLQGIPGLKGVGVSIANNTAPAAFHGERKEEIKKYSSENLKNLDNNGLLKRATSPTVFINPTEAAAIGPELARRGLTTDPKIAPLMDRFIEVAEKMGSAEGIYNNRPDLAHSIEVYDATTKATRLETRDETLARVIKSNKHPEEISHTVIGSQNSSATPTSDQTTIALNLTNPQLSKIASEGSAQQQEAFRNTIRQIRDTLGTVAVKSPAQMKQQERIDKIMDYISKSPNWQTI